MRSSRTKADATLLRTLFGILILTSLGGGVSAAAIAVAHTVTTLPSPRDARLGRLVDLQSTSTDADGDDARQIELASLTTEDDAVADSAADAPAPASVRDAAGAADATTTSSLPAAFSGKVASLDAALPAPKLKAAAAKPVQPAPKPQMTTVLSDAQIAALKQRLRLSPSQEPYWPEIEVSLRAVVRQIDRANRRAHGAQVPVDPSTPEVERLKSAAMPLLMQMRADQKAEVVALARLMGMEQVAAML